MSIRSQVSSILFLTVFDDASAMSQGDRVDDLTIGENITVPMNMSRNAFVTREPAMNLRPVSSSEARLPAESIPASAATTIFTPSML